MSLNQFSIYSSFSSDISVKRSECVSNNQVFDIYPLQKGFGATLANSIRRILYSISGIKVDWFKISGVKHQFSSIDGVVEDVVGISLNLKNIIIKSSNESEDFTGSVLTLTIGSKVGDVFASEIISPEGVEIVNGDLILMSVSKTFEPVTIEMSLKSGFGVEVCDESLAKTSTNGKIFLSKFYTPVKNVSFDVSDYIYNGDAKNFEKVSISVTTDGSSAPSKCLDTACAIGSGLFSAIIDINNESANELKNFVAAGGNGRGVFSQSGSQISSDDSFGKSSRRDSLITHIEFSVRTMNCLKSMPNVRYLSDLERFTQKDLLSKKNFGKKSLNEVEQRMQEKGFALKISSDDDESYDGDGEDFAD